MKIVHLADLHIGKVLLEQSLIEDQKYVIEEIIKMVINRKIDVILISGDIYDKGIPTTEAVDLLNDFLNTLIKKYHVKVLIISGNHDSKSRLNFGSKIFENEGLYIETNYNGKLKKISLDNVDIYMLPFVKPIEVKKYFDYEIKTSNDAIEAIIKKEKLDKNKINILMAHQFVTYNGEEPVTCESETLNIGTLDNIDAKLFFDFDYVALGHIHGAQMIGKDTIRYSGTMLKYSFSEKNHKKSIVLIDTDDGKLKYELVPLTPLRDLREIKGPIEELLNPNNYQDTNLNDYMKVILTDEEPGYSPLARIRTVYPNTLKLEVMNSKTINNLNEIHNIEKIKEKGELDLFKEFYKYQNNVDISERECEIVKNIIDNLESDDFSKDTPIEGAENNEIFTNNLEEEYLQESQDEVLENGDNSVDEDAENIPLDILGLLS